MTIARKEVAWRIPNTHMHAIFSLLFIGCGNYAFTSNQTKGLLWKLRMPCNLERNQSQHLYRHHMFIITTSQFYPIPIGRFTTAPWTPSLLAHALNQLVNGSTHRAGPCGAWQARQVFASISMLIGSVCMD